MGGFIRSARQRGWALQPSAWAGASPSAHVTRDAFERVSAMMIDELRSAGAVDAVYLDLHGAMVAEHIDDADGELLRRLRAVVGPDLPIVASLDFHANLSPQMAGLATALLSFRTYPHVDMAASGARAARCLHDLIGRPRPGAPEQLDFLLPLTSIDAGRSDALLMDEAIDLDRALLQSGSPAVPHRMFPSAPGRLRPAGASPQQRAQRRVHRRASAAGKSSSRSRISIGVRSEPSGCRRARRAGDPRQHRVIRRGRQRRCHDLIRRAPAERRRSPASSAIEAAPAPMRQSRVQAGLRSLGRAGRPATRRCGGGQWKLGDGGPRHPGGPISARV
jgi:hypothetical protein